MEVLLNTWPVFDQFRDSFLIGEMVWNFADFQTDQGKWCALFCKMCAAIILCIYIKLIECVNMGTGSFLHYTTVVYCHYEGVADLKL